MHLSFLNPALMVSQIRILPKKLIVCLAAVLLGACGGGSGDSPTPDMWTGIRQMGSAGLDTSGSGLTTDAAGNVFVVGTTEGSLAGNTMTGSDDLFLAKYDGVGELRVLKQLGSPGARTQALGAATDSESNVFVTGFTEGALDGHALTGLRDSLLVKFDNDGNQLLTRLLGAAGARTWGRAVATDHAGNVYVVGHTDGNLGGNVLVGDIDMFLTKYDNDGNIVFTRTLGVAGDSTYGVDIAVDAAGNIYSTGYTQGDLDGNTLAGIRDAFIAAYDSDGNKRFIKLIGVALGNTYATSVATDSEGSPVVTGYTNGNLGGNMGNGDNSAFITKLSRNTGSIIYTKLLSATGGPLVSRSVGIDNEDNIYVTGVALGDLDGAALTGTRDMFLAKYSNGGDQLWSSLLGSTGEGTWGQELAIDAANNVFVTGSTEAGLGGNPLGGALDYFVAKYSSEGALQ